MVKGQRVQNDIIFIPCPLWHQTLNLQDKKKRFWPTDTCECFHCPRVWSMGRKSHRNRPKPLCSKPLNQQCELILTVLVKMDRIMLTSNSSVLIVLWHEHDYLPRVAGLVHARTITQSWIRLKRLHSTPMPYCFGCYSSGYLCVITYNQTLIKIHLSITFIVLYRHSILFFYFVLHDCGTSKVNLTWNAYMPWQSP